MKCFYHSSDLDGIASAAIVLHRSPECDLIGINHGDDFDFDKITPGETVYMVDFSLPGDGMLELKSRCNLIWIDHHVTAIARLRSENIKGLQRVGIGACQLVWEYLYPDKASPYFIFLLAEWDVWDHSDSNCKPWQYGMRVETHNPYDDVWFYLFKDKYRDFFKTIIDKGHAVVKYEEQSNAMRVKSMSFETELDGLKCIACNHTFTNSTLFDSVWDDERYDAMITFGLRRSGWTVSLYSTKVDVSEIAVKYGGGGHKHSCGFKCQELPFELASVS